MTKTLILFLLFTGIALFFTIYFSNKKFRERTKSQKIIDIILLILTIALLIISAIALRKELLKENKKIKNAEQIIAETEHIHDFSYEMIDEDTHLVKCKTCNFTLKTEKHSLENNICSLCNFEHVHDFDYFSNDNKTHKLICKKCGYTIIEDCVFENNICTLCGYESTFNIVLTFTGDNMLADYKNTNYAGFNKCVEENGYDYFYKNVKQYFENDDFTIVNLENVFTDKNLPCRDKNENPGYWYYSKTDNVNILLNGNVEVAACCNNHIRDYGDIGMQDTFDTLTNAGIIKSKSEITYLEKNGFKIALICSGLWTEGQTVNSTKLVEEASLDSDFQIVYFHGGEMSIHKPDTFKVNGARKIVDSGADLVLGAHPHVLQPLEIYNDTPIVYSLGNFCYGGSKRPENRTVIFITTLTIDKESLELLGLNYEFIPCYVYTGNINNFQPTPIEDEQEKQNVLDFMNGLTDSPF